MKIKMFVKKFNCLFVGLSTVIAISGCSSVRDKSHPTFSQVKNIEGLASQSLIKESIKNWQEEIFSEWGDWGKIKDISISALDAIQRELYSKTLNSEERIELEECRKIFSKIFKYAELKENLEKSLDKLESCEAISEKTHEIIAAADELVKNCDTCLQHDYLFSEVEKSLIFELRVKGLREYHRSSLSVMFNNCRQVFEKAENSNHVVEACKKAEGMIEKIIKLELWTYQESKELDHIKFKFKTVRTQVEKEYNQIFKKNLELLHKAQEEFVKNSAARDTGTAKELYEKEKAKWFNPGLLVSWHPRDNTENLYRAFLFCERVRRDGRAGHTLQSLAYGIQNAILERLSSKEKEILSSHPRFPGYENIYGYPNWDVEMISQKEWQNWWFEKKQKKEEWREVGSEKGKFIPINKTTR